MSVIAKPKGSLFKKALSSKPNMGKGHTYKSRAAKNGRKGAAA